METAHKLAGILLAAILIAAGFLAAIAILEIPGMRTRGSVILMGALAVILYFGPSLAARSRHHRNAEAILTLNLLAGWTVIGWVIAAVWSATDNVAPPVTRHPSLE